MESNPLTIERQLASFTKIGLWALHDNLRYQIRIVFQVKRWINGYIKSVVLTGPFFVALKNTNSRETW